jgi:hypothetical protein
MLYIYSFSFSKQSQETSYTHLVILICKYRGPVSHIQETENVIFRLSREGVDHKLQEHQQDLNIILFDSSSIYVFMT